MITKFKLNDAEEKAAKRFEERHKHLDHNKGTIGGHIEYIFVPTSIGTAVTLHCSICDIEENITDYSSW